ncbi:MAG: DUF3015 family protein [Elusimicrobia bacterium]|nr:DUF3015 family protein [Elusimicrobiota bacterium]
MKKRMLAMLAAALLPTALLAGDNGNHPMAGCGLAYVLFSNKDNTKPIQVLASTTNNLWGTQSFGITSGTSGCTEDGAVKFVREAELYAEINLKDLSRDMATGRGEFLEAFSSLIGVKDVKRAEFARFVQERYDALFPSGSTTSTEMLESLSREMSARPDFLG